MTNTSPSTVTAAGRVALVGRPNVGKSTLLNALVGQRIAITSPHPQTTRAAVRGVRTTESAQYVFVDTPGVHAPRTRLGRWMNEVARQQAQDADAVVLVVEPPRGSKKKDGQVARESTEGEEPERAPAPPWAPSPADLALAADLPAGPVVLVINKIDRVADKSDLLPLMAGFCQARSFVAAVPLSATKRDGIDRLLTVLRDLLPEQPPLHDPDTLSDQPERFFVAELVREQVLRHTRQEVPHGVAVVVDRFDDTVKPLRIEATIVVAREAHTKILVGASGSMLKSIGIAARARVERMLGGRVHLALRVRASPGWMDEDSRLREFGYGALET